MDNTSKNVVVIGGGLAGITAALAAAKKGAQVTLVSSGPGTFAMSGGTVSVQGMSSELPYLEDAMGFFKTMTVEAGCEYKGIFNESTLIPNIMGDFQEVALVPASIWTSRPVNGSKVMIVGIHGLSGFSAQLTAELLTASAKKLGIGVTYSAANIKIPWFKNSSFTTLDVANCLEDKQKQEEFAELVQPLVRDNNLLLLPAIFRGEMKNEKINGLAKKVGCSVGELVTLPPSMVGLSVFQSLQKYLTKIGVEINIGYPAQALQLEEGYCTGVRMDNPGRKRIIKAQSIVVAAGKINKNNIAVNIKSKNNETVLQGNFTVNENMQLLNDSGIPIAANVYGAGSLLENDNPENGNALAILTGYRAGMMAVGVTR